MSKSELRVVAASEGEACPFNVNFTAHLKSVLEMFLAKGYIPSSQHPFQLIRLRDVGSKHLAFNVEIRCYLPY